MSGLFAHEIPLLQQYQFVIKNYDPLIVGNSVERESYIEYHQMILRLQNEDAVAA